VVKLQTIEQDRRERRRSIGGDVPSYLITYHGGSGVPTDPEAAQQMAAAFEAWVAKIGSALRDPGAPLGDARTVTADSQTGGQAEANVAGYTVIEAASLDDAVNLVRTHPFLTRGGSLQVSESVTIAA
jgi:hypothetical protein